MSVRDLPAILRTIENASTAHVIVVKIGDDRGEDVVSFNISDLSPKCAGLLREMLYEVYLRRGRAAVIARQARKERQWNWSGKARHGFAAAVLRFKELSVPLWRYLLGLPLAYLSSDLRHPYERHQSE